MTEAGRPDARDPQLALIGMPCWGVSNPFHALAAVGGIARHAGIRCTIHDLNVDFHHELEPEEQAYWGEDRNHLWFEESFPQELWSRYQSGLERRLDAIVGEHAPTLIAFSVNMSTRFFSIYAARYLKSRYPTIPILFGGVDCFPKEQFTAFIAPSDGYCDIVCSGEAEIAFRDFLKEFLETGDWRTHVPGFAYYTETRALVDTGTAELPDMKMPIPLPDYDQFDFEKYQHPGALPFYFSRGCPFKCHFCSEFRNFTRYRWRSAEDCFDELLAILPYAQRYSDRPSITCSDSNLNANMRELTKFANLILEHGVKIRWGGQAHLQKNMTTEALELLHRSGFSFVFWGFEHASQDVIDAMEKRYDVATGRRIIDDCRRLGIEQNLPIIIGFPGERPEHIVENAAFILEYKDKSHINIHLPSMLIVRPNSPLYDNYQEFGLTAPLSYEWRPSIVLPRFRSRKSAFSSAQSLNRNI